MRLTERIEPTRDRIYDPCCGTGGGFLQSEKFIEAHQCQKNEIAIYGQEHGHTTFGLSDWSGDQLRQNARWSQRRAEMARAMP
jgi:hypothetical protein